MIRQRAAAALMAVLASPAFAQTTDDANLVVTTLSTPGLSQPTTIGFVAPNDMLVLEKASGKVKRILSLVLQPTDALDLPVNSQSERGLLGIAVKPGSPVQVFLYYTEAASDGATAIANRVRRYDWSPGTGTLINPQLILDLPVTSGPNHDGGVLVWDNLNGHLYAMIGDLNRNGQLQNNAGGAAPDDTSVIYRVDANGNPVTGNPFTPYCSITTVQTCPTGSGCPGGENCRTQVARYYGYGVRNGFGLTQDPVNGALWDTENGPGNYDEINRVELGSNSGWNDIMGPDVRDPQGIGDLWTLPGSGVTYSDPEFSWNATVAPTGLLFPYATTWGASYNDKLLVGDNNNGLLYLFTLNPGRTGLTLTGDLADLVFDTNDMVPSTFIFGQGFGGISDIEKGPDDHVYVVSVNNSAIHRVAGPVPVELESFRVE